MTMLTRGLFAAIVASMIATQVFAADLLSAAKQESASTVPRSAISFGVGGNLNYSVYDYQYIYAVGNGTYFDQRGNSLATGYAQGPLKLGMNSQVRVAPTAQVKYFRYIDGSNLLFGANYSYSYLQSKSTAKNILIPQWGESYLRDGAPLQSVGNAYAHTYQSSLTHQMQLTPFVGYGLSNGFLYIGAGPSLSQVQTNIFQLIGFAKVSDQTTNQSGGPQNFSGSHWVFGGAVTAGGTYFLNHDWYLDFNYTYSQPRTPTNNYWSTFVNPVDSRIFLAGTLTGSSYGAVSSHSFVATLNYALDLSK